MQYIINFFEKKISYNDLVKKVVTNGNCKRINYYKNDELISYVDYRPHNGQIGFLYIIEEKHRNNKIGLNMLLDAMNDINPNCPIFAVTSKTNPFWSKLPFFKYYEERQLHVSITGDGYRLNNEDREKFIKFNHT